MEWQLCKLYIGLSIIISVRICTRKRDKKNNTIKKDSSILDCSRLLFVFVHRIQIYKSKITQTNEYVCTCIVQEGYRTWMLLSPPNEKRIHNKFISQRIRFIVEAGFENTSLVLILRNRCEYVLRRYEPLPPPPKMLRYQSILTVQLMRISSCRSIE